MTTLPGLSAMTLSQLHELQARFAVTISLHPDLKGHPMGKKTTKADLIDNIAATEGLSKAQAARVVEQLLHFITEEVAVGHKVALHGFGTFEPRFRQARTGRNPKTGEAVEIAASTSMGFRPSKRAGK